jgi:hypothetical protein
VDRTDHTWCSKTVNEASGIPFNVRDCQTERIRVLQAGPFLEERAKRDA